MSTTPSSKLTPGARFRAALEANRPLPILGTINAYTAMMAERVGHQAIYLSGGGVANASFGHVACRGNYAVRRAAMLNLR